MSSAQVLTIIASVDGGHNGEVRDRQIGVEILSDTEAIYSLIHWDTENDRPVTPTVVERYSLTLAELPPLPEESTEGDASIDDMPLAE